jgi:hypothetical protein
MELKMNLNHLTDNELIDHIIRYDEDPVRVRLATHMQRVTGAIIDDLEYAGMDPTYCEFRSIVTENQYHPGAYVRHLEDEIKYLWEKAEQDRKEIKELRARTIMDLIAELKQEITTAEYLKDQAIKDRQSAERKAEDMKHKLDMWTILKR